MQNKTLTDQVNTQRAMVKKNQILLKEAQRLDASNKKLMEEKKKLETENADLEKQRMSLKGGAELAGRTNRPKLKVNGSMNQASCQRLLRICSSSRPI